MIGVIDPGVRTLELDCFNSIVSISGKPAVYLAPAIYGLEGHQKFSDFLESGFISHVIVLGSASSVHDGFEWQRRLELLIKSVIDKKVPLLGICYGHQMLAHMFGGDVQYVNSDKQKELGSREITLDSKRLDYQNTRANFVVTHNEMVGRMPSDFCVVGVSGVIAIDAMEHRSLPIFSIQAHPEATRSFVLSREMFLEDCDRSLRDGEFFMRKFFEI